MELEIWGGGYSVSSTFKIDSTYSCKSELQKLKEDLELQKLKEKNEELMPVLETVSPTQLKLKIRNRL